MWNEAAVSGMIGGAVHRGLATSVISLGRGLSLELCRAGALALRRGLSLGFNFVVLLSRLHGCLAESSLGLVDCLVAPGNGTVPVPNAP